jgi:hypothetical protein
VAEEPGKHTERRTEEAGAAAELGVGFGVAQQMTQAAGLPELLSPADAAKSLGVNPARGTQRLFI